MLRVPDPEATQLGFRSSWRIRLPKKSRITTMMMRRVICSAIAVLLSFASGLSGMCRECQSPTPVQNCAATHKQTGQQTQVSQPTTHTECEHIAAPKKTPMSDLPSARGCQNRTCQRELGPATQMKEFRGAPMVLVYGLIASDNGAWDYHRVGETPLCISFDNSQIRPAYDPLSVNLRI